MSYRRSHTNSSSSSRSADGNAIELSPIPEEPPPTAESRQSSEIIFSPALMPGPASSDALLAPEDESGFPWHHSRLSPGNGSSDSLIDQNDPVRSSWPLGVKLGLFLVASVLLLNAAVTLWASITFSVDGGLGTIYRGVCSQVQRTGFLLHIAINIVGTLLLGASNYCMQCLTSPTRKEIDRHHRRKSWLEVGMLSVRNLRAIDRRRLWLWILLGASSFPIHLMFNSAVFVTLTANQYTIAAVTRDFVKGGNWSLTRDDSEHENIITMLQRNLSTFERLEPNDCIAAYGVDFLSDRRNVVIVTHLEGQPNSLLGTLDWTYDVIQNSWICGSNVTDDMILVPEDIDDYDCTIAEALSSPMSAANKTVDYCLSQQVSDICRLQFSLPIMLIVILCNIVKLLCILLILMTNDATIITLGDAIVSFLHRPEPTTRGMGYVTMQDLKAGYWPDEPKPRRWVYQRYFRWQAVSFWRFAIINFIGLVSCVLLGVLLSQATNATTTNPDIYTWWALGFGTVSKSSLVHWPDPQLGDTGLIRNVLLANFPQLLLSTMYLSYNQLYTCMAFADEYASYFRKRQPLRVTFPRGAQRSTYFLTLPYRYIVPFMLVSATTHFLLSQGFFLVAIDVFDLQGQADPGAAIMTVGFSISALVVLLAVAGLVVLIGVGMGFRRYPAGMPLAGPNSAAISAACHLGEGEDGRTTAEKEVQWGVVDTTNGVGQLAFSAGIVGEPVPGRLYM